MIDDTLYCGKPDCADRITIGSIERLRVAPSGKLEPVTIGIDAFSLPWLSTYNALTGSRHPTIFEFTGSGEDQHIIVASFRFVCEVGVDSKSHCPFNEYYSPFDHLWAGNEYYSYWYCDPRMFTGLYGEYGQGNNVFSLEPPPGCSYRVRFLGYSPQFNAALYEKISGSGSTQYEMFLYDIANKKYINKWKWLLVRAGVSGNYSYGLISPNGRYAAILLDRKGMADQVMIYDLSTKELITTEILKDSFENLEPSLAFSVNGQILAMLSPGSSLSIHILTLNKPTEQLNFDLCSSLPESWCPEHSASVVGFAISPNARLLALGNSKGEILLVDATNGAVVNMIQAHTGPILRLAFNEDGSLLASLERSGIVKIWGIAP